MQYPQNLAELLSWPYQGQPITDRWGTFYKFTGFEGEGVCYWCGGELTRKATRWCRTDYGTDNAHWRLYHCHFDWNYASSWALKRANYKCLNCGIAGAYIKRDNWSSRMYNLEVHHIIPLNGQRYQYSLYHVPWNLIALCHDCHLEVAVAMRAPKPFADTWLEAKRVGQGIMFSSV